MASDSVGSSLTPLLSPNSKKDSSAENIITDKDQQMLLTEEKNELQKEILIREEKLRKLKMVQLYRNKNDLSNLEELITKWKQASQEVIVDLLDALPEPKPSVSNMLKTFQIDSKLLSYNEEDECFLT